MLTYIYSSKYPKFVYHILSNGKSLCHYEHNLQRNPVNLDVIVNAPPNDRRICNNCRGKQIKFNYKFEHSYIRQLKGKYNA